MDKELYKECPSCKEKNLASARFCVGCEKEFGKKAIKTKPKKVVAAQLPPPPPPEEDEPQEQPDDLGVEVSETDRAEARRIASGFQIQVEEGDRPRGISLEEVISNQVKPAPRERRVSNDKRSGLKILQQDGGNPKR